MPIEIERKFLLRNNAWRTYADDGKYYIQGYISGSAAASIRIRIEGNQAYINIKSATLGISRREYEYPIPVSEAQEMLDELCDKPLIEKTRYHVHYNGCDWEIDVFEGENAGLVVAEIELSSEKESFECPAWLGDEVSDDVRYYNVNLVRHPFSMWKHES